jgi:hypothetical protein
MFKIRVIGGTTDIAVCETHAEADVFSFIYSKGTEDRPSEVIVIWKVVDNESEIMTDIYVNSVRFKKMVY